MDVEKAIQRLREAGYYAHYRMGVIEVKESGSDFIKIVDINKLSRTVLSLDVQRLLERKQQSEGDAA